MDSIERMRRLNELTKELKQRGFAESSFEAIAQANQIYGDDELSHDVKHGLINNSTHEKITKEDKMDMQEAANTNKKINELSSNIEMLTSKMNEIIQAINDMDARITALKNRPTERVVEKVVEKETRKEEVHEHSAQPAHEEHHEHKEEKPKDEYANQRVGNYQSNDVAIDKMFYFGKK